MIWIDIDCGQFESQSMALATGAAHPPQNSPWDIQEVNCACVVKDGEMEQSKLYKMVLVSSRTASPTLYYCTTLSGNPLRPCLQNGKSFCGFLIHAKFLIQPQTELRLLPSIVAVLLRYQPLPCHPLCSCKNSLPRMPNKGVLTGCLRECIAPHQFHRDVTSACRFDSENH